jgi:hypothetical protein
MLVGAYPFEDPQEPRDYRKTIQVMFFNCSCCLIHHHSQTHYLSNVDCICLLLH